MIRLVPMDADEFGPYLDRLIRSYADEHIKAGRWSREDGLAEARKEVEKLLPAGRESRNQFFLSIVSGAEEQHVGAVWLAIEPRGGFVYDLLVFERYRRQGFAREAMLLLERIARDKGARKISLHVFGHNQAARSLYARLGYVETDVVMSKELAP